MRERNHKYNPSPAVLQPPRGELGIPPSVRDPIGAVGCQGQHQNKWINNNKRGRRSPEATSMRKANQKCKRRSSSAKRQLTRTLGYGSAKPIAESIAQDTHHTNIQLITINADEEKTHQSKVQQCHTHNLSPFDSPFKSGNHIEGKAKIFAYIRSTSPFYISITRANTEQTTHKHTVIGP